MQTLIKKILILCITSMLVLLAGCAAKDTYYGSYFNQELTEEDVKEFVDNYDPENFDVCELLESSTWYGLHGIEIRKKSETTDERIMMIYGMEGVIKKDGKYYCADPFDDYFDKVREIGKKYDIYLVDALADTDVEDNPTQPYLVYLFGAYKSEEEMRIHEEHYGVSDKNNYHTAICTGLCNVKDVLALFDIESNDDTLIDDAYASAKNFEGYAAVNAGLRIKLINDRTYDGLKMNIYLIKPDN